MIVGVGIDIIEIHRIDKSLERNDRLIQRILTNKERELLQTLTHPRRRTEFVAGRFAAKEAVAKAFGTGIGPLSFQHIVVYPDENGAPQVDVEGYEDYQIFISISHSKEYAVAQAIIEKG